MSIGELVNEDKFPKKKLTKLNRCGGVYSEMKMGQDAVSFSDEKRFFSANIAYFALEKA